jgi:2-polyprenyl-3-methyl-5-hydroxy-6-metoxy-1,4-benzoquinol methylase
MRLYDTKKLKYFSNARIDIEPLLPSSCGSVLDVGCGTGDTLRWLRESGRSTFGCGIEKTPEPAAYARAQIDELLEGDAEEIVQELLLTPRRYDVILCLDVLEHLADPWRMVMMLQELVAPSGVLIASIPNIRNLDAILPLIFRGNWEYAEEGILDATHLRFFTRNSAHKLMSSGRLQVVRIIPNMPKGRSKRALFNKITIGLLADFLTVQYLIASHVKD